MNLLNKLRRRRYRKLARRVSSELVTRFGRKEFYSANEIEAVAEVLDLSTSKKEIAFGMFTEEWVCQSFLERIRSSKSAADLRRFLAAGMFGGGFTASYDSGWNRFHDTEDEIGGGLSAVTPPNGGIFGGDSDDHCAGAEGGD